MSELNLDFGSSSSVELSEQTQAEQQQPKLAFNPVKEDVDGKVAHRMIWSTESVAAAYRGLCEGKKLVANPFYEYNTHLLKGDLNFQRTAEEVEDFKHCMTDILYFASKCKLMTPEGIQKVTLRDYQSDYLRHLEKHRLSIFLSCRQSGKCELLTTKVLVKIDNESCLHLKKDNLKCYCISKEDNIYNVPIFEIYNFYDKSIKWKFKYVLYKLLYKITNNYAKRSKNTRKQMATY